MFGALLADDQDEYVNRAMRAGAGGFLLKDAPIDSSASPASSPNLAFATAYRSSSTPTSTASSVADGRARSVDDDLHGQL